jgi:hypothetical protein
MAGILLKRARGMQARFQHTASAEHCALGILFCLCGHFVLCYSIRQGGYLDLSAANCGPSW